VSSTRFQAAAKSLGLKGTSSEESPNPKIQKLPRKPGNQRDFGMLTPGAKARHAYSGPASEQESMSEGKVESAFGQRPGEKMRLSNSSTPYQHRDMQTALRKKV
jgi:hypothetical protein